MSTPEQPSTAEIDPSDTLEPIPPRLWWLKRILVGVGILLVALVCLRMWWGWQANKRLEAAIARYQAAGEPILPSDFDQPAIADEDNAVYYLNRAAAAIVDPADVGFTIDDVVANPASYRHQTEKLALIIEANANALALVGNARYASGVDWGTRMRSPMIKSLLPSTTEPRRLARLLYVSAMYHHDCGEDSVAIQEIGDILRIARVFDEMPGVLVSHLVAITIDRTTADVVKLVAPTLSVDQAVDRKQTEGGGASREQVLALIDRLLNFESFRREWKRAIYGERAMVLDVVNVYGEEDIAVSWGARRGIPAKALSLITSPMLKLEAIEGMASMTTLAEAGLADNYPDAKDAASSYATAVAGYKKSISPITSILMQGLERSLILHFHGIAMRRMAAIALALRLFELDHGRRPATLSELVPEYLQTVPKDPFAADGRAIAYRPEAAKPLLYSVGVDGVDQGGTLAMRFGRVDRTSADLPFSLVDESSTQSDEDHDDIRDNRGDENEDSPPDHYP